jgi:hypothetical protein
MKITIYFKTLVLLVAIRLTEEALAAGQSQQLQAFYDHLGGRYWTTQSGWNSPGFQGNECSASGIICSNDGTNVIGFQMPNFNLSGSISEYVCIINTTKE